MEEVSLALADLVLIFGPRGNEIALTGRLPEVPQPVCAPRFVKSSLLDKIANVSNKPIIFCHSPALYLDSSIG